ncbi:MAG: hypothetical protein LIO72_01315 [Ruminococcus sp.]|nr:hypothetical protein [Ruminococcus sp.]
MKPLKAFLTLFSIVVIIAYLHFEESLTASGIVVAVVLYCLSYAVHLLAHECGHLIGGKISGYKLLRLQLGPVNIVRNQKGKLSLKWKSQLSGQCIMVPKKTESVRFKAYNLGGAMANINVSVLSLALLPFDSFYSTLLFIELLLIGIQKSLVNLIPHKSNSVPNDGYIVGLLNHNEVIQGDYAVYLTLYAKLLSGEEINIEEYTYERIMAGDDEMLYYNEIQNILKELSLLGKSS